MAIAFTFPGQGSQAVGMGKALAEHSAAARAVFAEVDEALGQKLSALMFDGPEDELTLTANAQPALMAVSMALIRIMEERGIPVTKAAYVAGHSLGEYSALCAAGTFSLADTARLLRIRGNAMQAAVPVGMGAMAAIIGAEAAAVAQLCRDAAQGDICQIANDNGGGQLVISGSAPAVARAIELAPGFGAKRAIPLSVSAPFHSALMQPAADAMAEALAKVEKCAPARPVVANVSVTPLTDPEAIAASLVQQVTGQVRWRETVEWFAENGVTTLYEIGSGKVLTGLAKRISKDVAGVAVNTVEDVEALAAAIGN
ncbi:MAG: ACP S-malonyltransferase [Rhizobiaceae bacterium]|jgi:[acyl-carrier-protein] S-malonyltransferase|nr:ACP S-malonyltransferase [Rhizobiaceae bacterium]